MIDAISRVRLLAALVLCAALGPVRAGPAEDFERGRAAFHRDDLMGAIQALRRASEAGHTDAQALLAYILDRAEEDKEALALYSQAAAKGNADAMYGLGSMYGSGEGVPKDEAKAVEWFRRAEEAGHNHAAVVLAEAYQSGTMGLPRDPAQAQALLKRAAARGYEPARQRLDQLAKRAK